jgi:hypothetical protein
MFYCEHNCGLDTLPMSYCEHNCGLDTLPIYQISFAVTSVTQHKDEQIFTCQVRSEAKSAFNVKGIWLVEE